MPPPEPAAEEAPAIAADWQLIASLNLAAPYRIVRADPTKGARMPPHLFATGGYQAFVLGGAERAWLVFALARAWWRSRRLCT